MEPSEAIEFRYDDWSTVLARMDALAAGGRGWLNLLPEVEGHDDADAATRSGGLAGLLRSRGPTVPMGTWVASTPRTLATVGVQHGATTRVLRRLRTAGAVPPDGWIVVQDHPRRGVVLRLPQGTGADEVMAWLMAAVDELCPMQLTGQWLAEIHDR